MKPTILVVDDEPTIRRLLEYNLKENKFNVVTANDGKEALLWLQEGNLPDLIVTDIMMPNIDGYQFIKNVRTSGFFRDIPVIFLSAKAQSKERIHGLQLGADDYMTKPFNPEELIARIDNILRRVKVS